MDFSVIIRKSPSSNEGMCPLFEYSKVAIMHAGMDYY